MTEAVLKMKERQDLEQIALQAKDARLVNRAYALLWLDEGEAAHEIATQLGVSRQSIYNWADRFHERAGQPVLARLADGPRNGRPCTATGIIDPLIDKVVDFSPRKFHYPSTIWTAPLLVRYLADHHQLKISVPSVRLAIGRLRIRWKRPRHYLALRSPTWQQAKGG